MASNPQEFPQAELIELGAGSLKKVRYILRELDAPTAFLSMDISGNHLNAAAETIKEEFPLLRISPIVADHTKYWLLPACSKETKRRVAFFPGSTIGNFSPREVQDWFGLLWFNIPGKTLN